MITDFPNILRQFVYLSRYAPPTPEALTSNLSVPEGAGERCCASCKRRVAILSYEHKQKADRIRGLFFCFTYYIDLKLYKIAEQSCTRFAVASDCRFCCSFPQTKVRNVL